jgi:hypothetical protein
MTETIGSSDQRDMLKWLKIKNPNDVFFCACRAVGDNCNGSYEDIIVDFVLQSFS